MSTLDLELDAQLSALEQEWRDCYEASIEARAEYQRLAGDPKAGSEQIDAARERLDRAEALKSRVSAKIEWLEIRTFD